MTHQSFLRCKILEMCHLYSGLDCAKSLVFSITATLDWSRITWPRASWLRQGALKFIIVASRFVDGSDKRDRSKFNFEDKKRWYQVWRNRKILNFNCLNQIKQWNFSGKWLFISIRLKNWNRMVSASKKFKSA